MKNYLVINQFYNAKSFETVYGALQNAFAEFGEELEIITNVQARGLLTVNGKGAPVLFFDKDVNLAKLLEKAGYRCVNNSFVIETCDDKSKTYLALKDNFLMPKTILAPFCYDGVKYSSYEFLEEMGEELGYPLIVKENKGSFGAQVYKVNDINELENLVKGFNHCQFLLQEFVETSVGKDLRVYVVGGKAVAYAQRYNENDFRSNINFGGSMVKVEIESKYTACAEEVAKALGADFCGIDLLFGNDDPLVCEVNSNAQFNALSETTGVNVAKEIVKYFLALKNKN